MQACGPGLVLACEQEDSFVMKVRTWRFRPSMYFSCSRVAGCDQLSDGAVSRLPYPLASLSSDQEPITTRAYFKALHVGHQTTSLVTNDF